MIGRVRGLLIEKAPGNALVECAGLGYEIDIPYTTFFHLPDTGQEVTLHTHLPFVKMLRACLVLPRAWTGTCSAC